MQVMLSREQIEKRIRELALEIERDYGANEEIHLVCVLKGGFVFLSDLVRSLKARVTLDFIAMSSYGKARSRRARCACSAWITRSRPPRHHRRGHRRHRAHAALPAGDPAGAESPDPADGLSAEQAQPA
jgi:hypoxanthine phosphoribosyltransferase